jgi:hypothetical protein
MKKGKSLVCFEKLQKLRFTKSITHSERESKTKKKSYIRMIGNSSDHYKWVTPM